MAFQGIRDKNNQNQKPFIIGDIVIACLAIALMVSELTASTIAAPNSYYFYDTSNGTIITEPATAIPPLKGTDGKQTLVLAKFFTCTTCGDRKIGYLVKYTAQAKPTKQLLSEPLPDNATPVQKSQHAAEISALQMSIAEGRLVRLLAKGSPWISALSFKGMQLIKNASQCPGGKYAKPCLP